MSFGQKCLWVVGCILYVICPLDFDFIPIVGWIDDVVVIGLTVEQVFSG